jgi:hypothetical protein
LPKEGNSVEEYEDAYSCSDDERQFAVADGATESSFADIWAQSLANQFTASPPAGSPPTSDTMEGWITPLQKQWHAQINWDRLPWYAEEKARTGAFATMLGMRLFDVPEEKVGFFARLMGAKPKPAEIRWQAIAVGDSNLFQIRANSLIKAFPLEKAEQFNSRPMLLASNPARNHGVWQELRVTEGLSLPDDLFFLATDALSKWFLDRCEHGARPWQQLLAIKSDSDYLEFVQKLRKTSAIRNDDTTLLILRCRGSQ